MTSTVLTDVEKNACLILPDLFLDIEVASNINWTTRPDISISSTYPWILSIEFSATIFFPILIYILWSVAGEWMGFDEPSLIQQIEYQRMKPPGTLTGCARSAAWLAFEGMVTLPWDQFKRKCSILFKVVVALPPELIHTYQAKSNFELHRLINT